MKTPFSEIKSLKPSSDFTVSIITPFPSPSSPISRSLSPSSSPSFSSTIPFKLIFPIFDLPKFFAFFDNFDNFDNCEIFADEERESTDLFDEREDLRPHGATISFVTLPGGSADRTLISARVPSPPP